MRLLLCIAFLALAACATAEPDPLAEEDEDFWGEAEYDRGYLFRAETVIEDDWHHQAFHGRTLYRLAILEDALAIQATGQESSSGLMRRVRVDPQACPEIEWAWSVMELQPGADLEVREQEDVAAAFFLMFGDPGLASDPEPVPTLRYVWTGGDHRRNQIIDSPYLPGTVRSLVVRQGNAAPGRWQIERRNLLEDYQKAFGTAPSEPIEAIALFTDNDQTGEAVEAYYGWARVHCSS